MESKYNLLTRLLKNIKNVITPDGSVAGSGGGVMVVHATDDAVTGDLVLDKTYQEIEDAGFCVLDILMDSGLHNITSTNGFGFNDAAGGTVVFGPVSFRCSSRTDYPVYHDGK